MESGINRFLIGLIAVITAASLRAQDFSWASRAAMPAPRWGASTFVANGLAFVVGGRSNGIDHPQLWAYDPIQDTWSPKAPFPGMPRRLATSFAANGKGYYGCGITGSSTYLSDFWEYDPVSDSWSQKADFPPGPRYNTWQFVIDGVAYVGGGNSAGSSGPFHADAYTYNPATDTWTAAAPIPDQGRHGAIGLSHNGIGYVICGRENSLVFVQDLWAFNPASGTWTPKAPFPGAPRSSPLVFSYYNDFVVGCGRDGAANHYDAWLYRPGLDAWQQIPDYPGATAMAGCSFAIGNRAFGGLGWDLSTDLSHADLWELVKPDNTGVEGPGSAPGMRIWPNPAEGASVQVRCDSGEGVWLELISSDGKHIGQWSFTGTFTLPTAGLAAGAYMLHWTTASSPGGAKALIIP